MSIALGLQLHQPMSRLFQGDSVHMIHHRLSSHAIAVIIDGILLTYHQVFTTQHITTYERSFDREIRVGLFCDFIVGPVHLSLQV
jgi:hypothetical protein